MVCWFYFIFYRCSDVPFVLLLVLSRAICTGRGVGDGAPDASSRFPQSVGPPIIEDRMPWNVLFLFNYHLYILLMTGFFFLDRILWKLAGTGRARVTSATLELSWFGMCSSPRGCMHIDSSDAQARHGG